MVEFAGFNILKRRLPNKTPNTGNEWRVVGVFVFENVRTFRSSARQCRFPRGSFKNLLLRTLEPFNIDIHLSLISKKPPCHRDQSHFHPLPLPGQWMLPEYYLLGLSSR